MKDRVSLIVFSGTVDKLMAASILATGGAAMDMEVELFLTTWGLEAFRKGNYKTSTEIQYLFPLPRVFPIESVAEAVTPLLEERNIGYTVFFNAETVDTEKRTISSLEGEEIPCDLLVLVPPHRGARVGRCSRLDTNGPQYLGSQGLASRVCFG